MLILKSVLYIFLYLVWAMAMEILLALLVFKMFQIQRVIWGKGPDREAKRDVWVMGNNYKKELGERESIFPGQMCFTHLELLSSIPSIAALLPSPPLCFSNFILFPCVKGSLCPITFPFHSHTVAFIIPYPSTVCFISEFYNPHLQGALFSFHRFSIRGVVYLYVFIHSSFSRISR